MIRKRRQKERVKMSKAVKGIALAFALIMCLAFSACGEPRASSVLTNNSGVVLIIDDAIDVTDSDSEARITNYLIAGNAAQLKSGVNKEQMSLDVYAKGNVLVMEYYITVELDDGQKASVRENLTPMMTKINVSDGRKDTGADNLVVVYSLFDKENNIIMSEILK